MGKLEDAKELFSQLIAEGFKPGFYTYTTLIRKTTNGSTHVIQKNGRRWLQTRWSQL
jgi:hypothetical protein